MKLSLNEILLSIPLYQLTFITPFPNEEIFYEHVSTSFPRERQECPTVLIIKTKDDWLKLTDRKYADQLVQDSYLRAIVIYNKTKNPFPTDILTLFEQCQIPIIQLDNDDSLAYFLQESESQTTFNYRHLSYELDGFYKRGFIDIATNLSTAFRTPLLFLDENEQLLWHTGSRKELSRGLQWLRSRQADINRQTSQTQSPFESYMIDIAGQMQISLIASTDLAHWQKRMIDKFIGFTAVLFQTDEVVRAQNEQFKEFFIYELLYRKFESKKALIQQGKTWGWHLEKPHHLLVLEVESSFDEPVEDVDILDEIVFHLETHKTVQNEQLIILPFQEHIIVLVEHERAYTPQEKKNVPKKIAQWIENEVAQHFPNCMMHIGIGKWYFDTIHLNKSYQEAKIAIQFGKVWFENKRIYHMNDLGVLHLLSNIHRDQLYDFCQENLAPLIQSDQEHDTEYLKTLKMYIQYHGVTNDVAEALFIHPNTLRKRLTKIEELIDFNRQNLEQLLTLMVAIKVYYSFSL